MNSMTRRRIGIVIAIVTIILLFIAAIAIVWPGSDAEPRHAVDATMTASPPRFTQLNIGPIANWPLEHLANPPTGQVSFAEIPFTILIGRKSIFQTQHHLLMDLPIQGSLQTSISRPMAVHILLNGEYMDRQFQDRKVGEVNLGFADGTTLNTSLIAYQNVRESWAFKSDSMADAMGAPQAGVLWRNVWLEQQNRGDQPAEAFIDMTTILLPEPYASGVLTSISIQDTSVDTVGSRDPSLIVMAITVESQQTTASSRTATGAPTATEEPLIAAPPTPTVSVPPKVVQVAVGEGHSCALLDDGMVECWGRNDHGQLGDGTTLNRSEPVRVDGLPPAAEITAGWAHTCAATKTGAAYCWGYNKNGELGNGKTADSGVPMQVYGLKEGVLSVVAGDDHTCAVLGVNGMRCWGLNSDGQAGNGTKFDQRLPVKVAGLEGRTVSAAAGWAHTCALNEDGGVQCWGNNEQGQLGNHSNEDSSPTPVDVTGLTYGVESIAARGGHTCAVLTEGKTVCWGNNAYGELGDGTAEIRNEPVPVSGLPEDIVGLYAGWNYSCALSLGDGLLCWGRNTYGQLGDGTATSRLHPIRIMDAAVGIRSVSLGWRHTCIADQTGAVRCWGANEAGQLGNGLGTNSNVPVEVRELEK
jgi:alpha-tubulin suppressor-like RCC1 family protein